MSQLPAEAQAQLDDGLFKRMAVIIDSMTIQERRFPDLISGSRKQRIARGAGAQLPEVNRVLKQHKQMQKMMKKVTRKGGMQKMMRGVQSMRRPPGFQR
jgi:signal recognition particle subunit SRP54